MSFIQSKDLTANDFISVTDMRHELFNLLNKVEESNRSYTLTRRGVPIAQILNYEQWRGILTTLEILVSPGHQAKLDKRIKEVKQGKAISFKQAFGQ